MSFLSWTFTALVWLAVWVGLLVAVRKLTKFLLKKHKTPWSAKGRVVVITGASSGIGEEMAYQYAAEGARLVLCARRVGELDRVSKECTKKGAGAVLAVKADMSEEKDCYSFIEQASKFGDGVIDLLVLNAGISMGCFLEDFKPEGLKAFKDIMAVNYHAIVTCVYAALPALKRSSRSKIAAVSSGFGCLPGASRSGYCGSKFALHGFLESLRLELGPKYGTEITVICPGVVATDINRTRLGAAGTADADTDGAAFSIDMKRKDVMPVAEAVRRSIAAISVGAFQEDLTGEITLGRHVKLLLPELFDVILLRKLRQAGIIRT